MRSHRVDKKFKKILLPSLYYPVLDPVILCLQMVYSILVVERESELLKLLRYTSHQKIFVGICGYLRLDLRNIDLFVQSRLKPAWRASRAENLLKFALWVQSRLKLAWRASRAENSLKFVLFVQLRLKPAWRASRAENLLKFAFFVCFGGIWESGYAHVS